MVVLELFRAGHKKKTGSDLSPVVHFAAAAAAVVVVLHVEGRQCPIFVLLTFSSRILL